MDVYFSKTADKQLKDWIKSDANIAKKIYELIEDIQKNGFLHGIGKPEQLKYYKNPASYSRRINQANRL